MFILVIRFLFFVLILTGIYISISFFQRRDARIKLQAECDDPAEIEVRMQEFERRARPKRLIFVFMLPFAFFAILLWLALK